MSHNVNLVIWEMFYKEILEETGPEGIFSEHLNAQILRNLLLGANHGGIFVGLTYVPVCPKTLWMRQVEISIYISSPTRIPRKKLNSPSVSGTLRNFTNQKY